MIIWFLICHSVRNVIYLFLHTVNNGIVIISRVYSFHRLGLYKKNCFFKMSKIIVYIFIMHMNTYNNLKNGFHGFEFIFVLLWKFSSFNRLCNIMNICFRDLFITVSFFLFHLSDASINTKCTVQK